MPIYSIPGIISIHALREEGDVYFQRFGYFGRFLSTPSVRRATQMSHVLAALMPISIHALREEGDEKLWE